MVSLGLTLNVAKNEGGAMKPKPIRAAVAALALSLLAMAGCSTTGLPKAGEGGAPSSRAGSGAAARISVAAPSSRSEKRPLVLAHYMPWFQAPPVSSGYGFHWHQGGAVFDPYATLPDGRASIASNYYPLTGPYDSRDPELLRYQAALMKMAGIDGVVFDWYGMEDALDYKSVNDSTLAMVEVLKAAGLKFAICYEDQSVAKMIEAKKLPKGQGLAEGERTFAWMQERWFDDPAYVKVGGRPLVLCFGPQYFKTSAEWDSIFARTRVRPYFVCLDDQGGSFADGSYDWMPMWASEGGVLSPNALASYLNRYYAKQVAVPFLVATAFPGFHDIYQKAGSGKGYGYLDYAAGEVFKSTVEAAARARADVLQIATWNDYGEGTMIEPTIERGYAELERLQDLRRDYDASFAYDYSDLRAPIELYKAAAGASGVVPADAAREQAVGAAYSAIFAGDARAYRRALKAARIATDFGVNPLLRDPSAPAAGKAVGSGYDPEGRQNLALGMPAVYSSSIYDFVGGKAVDGDIASYWEGAANSYPDSLTVDLVSPRRIGALVLKLNPKRVWGARTERIEVLASEDGENYSVVAPAAEYLFDPAANANSVVVRLGCWARFLRLVVTANSGATGAQVAELEVYGE